MTLASVGLFRFKKEQITHNNHAIVDLDEAIEWQIMHVISLYYWKSTLDSAICQWTVSCLVAFLLFTSKADGQLEIK